MISWKACKALGILPQCYVVPQPLPPAPANSLTLPSTMSINVTTIKPWINWWLSESCRVKSFTLPFLRQQNHFAFTHPVQICLHTGTSFRLNLTSKYHHIINWGYHMVCTNCSDIKVRKTLRRSECALICHSLTIFSSIPVTHTSRSSRQHCSKWIQGIHSAGYIEGYHRCPLDYVSQSISHHFHYAIRTLQISLYPLQHFIHFWALQP